MSEEKKRNQDDLRAVVTYMPEHVIQKIDAIARVTEMMDPLSSTRYTRSSIVRDWIEQLADSIELDALSEFSDLVNQTVDAIRRDNNLVLAAKKHADEVNEKAGRVVLRWNP